VVERRAQTILLGRALDAEDGSLDAGAFVWASDLDGTLGTGDDLTVRDLSPGWHTITLEVTDSDGQTGVDSMTIFVSRERAYLPLITVR